MRQLRSVLLGALVASVASTAQASPYDVAALAHDAEQRIAVLPIRVEGRLESHWQELLRRRLLRRLKGAVTVADDASIGDAAFVLAAEVSVTDNDYKVIVRLLDGKTRRVVASGEDSCELCGVEEVGDILADQAFILRQRAEAVANAPPRLTVTSQPPGALIYVDGELIGKTPLERVVAAGPHEVRAEKSGHLASVASVVTSPGGRHAQRLELDRIPRIQRAAPWAWGMLGAGGLGLTAGVTLLILDGRQYQPRCSGSNVDDDGDCRFRYGTRVPGIVFTTLGAATIVAAAIILAVARSRRVKTSKAGGVGARTARRRGLRGARTW